MSGTTVAEAHGLLYDLLVDAFAGEPDVQVTYGPPEVYELRKVVSITGQQPVGQREDWAALGNADKAEEYSIDVVVKVHDPVSGNTPEGAQATYTEAFRLVEAIRGVVHESKGLGLNTADAARNARAQVSGATGGAEPAQGGGFVTYVEVVVTVYARIRA